MDAPCRIRPARRADVGAVAALERAIFSDPWTESSFEEAFAGGVTFLVAEGVAEPAEVIGYILAHHAAGEGEILSLGVAPHIQRRGVGRALVAAIVAALGGVGVGEIFLEVRESNGAARALYAGFGFREVGRRARYYRQPVEDAVVLRAANSAAGAPA